MGRKVHPNAIRMGINKTWNSVWYASKADYPRYLEEDLKLRRVITQKVKGAGIDRIKIKRTLSKIDIEVFVARPGVAIGRGGEGIDQLQKDLKRMMKMEIEVKVREIKKADLSARVIARQIADGIERAEMRKSFRSF